MHLLHNIFSKTFQNILHNLPDYLLVVGLFFIGFFIYQSYGFDLTVLYSGVVLVGTSFAVEFSRKSKKPSNRNW